MVACVQADHERVAGNVSELLMNTERVLCFLSSGRGSATSPKVKRFAFHLNYG